MLKKIRSVFNENIDQLYVLKKIRTVFNENTNQFYVLKSEDIWVLHYYYKSEFDKDEA